METEEEKSRKLLVISGDKKNIRKWIRQNLKEEKIGRKVGRGKKKKEMTFRYK